MRRIYFDHNATTPVDPAVLAEMLPYLGGEYGNASPCTASGSVRAAPSSVRASRWRRSSGRSRPKSSSPAAAPNRTTRQSAASWARRRALGDRRGSSTTRLHVITSAIEHAAVLHTCQALARRAGEGGADVTYLPVSSDGVVDPEQVRGALRPDTILITIMHANNEVGTIEPIAEIGAVAREAGVLFHTDGVQSVGKLAVDVKQLNVDMLSLSGHKFYGPKGVGALYLRNRVRITPLFHGGAQERRRRAGTQNVPGIVGLAKALDLAMARLDEETVRERAMRDRLQQGLLERVPGARVNGDAVPRTPNTCNMLFPGVESESLVIALDLQGIACSAGAALFRRD